NTVGADFTPGDGQALRVAWELQGKRILLSVGRMSAEERYKGHDRVVAALPALLKDGFDVVYVVVGEGDDHARLRALAQQVGVADRVRFVGVLDPATLIEAYRMADLFVMPSTGEGFGNAFLEAMACGTPALGLDVAGARDALADGELGTLTTEAQLTEALARLLSQGKPDARALSAAVARRFGREPFAARACAAIAGLRNAA
ncbi:MAG: glycosyltransferase, partial [Hyphomicrobium sp.]|nr:glycosyltransferase [Hyphomicrobium sp.]